jgi:hypothetical protein
MEKTKKASAVALFTVLACALMLWGCGSKKAQLKGEPRFKTGALIREESTMTVTGGTVTIQTGGQTVTGTVTFDEKSIEETEWQSPDKRRVTVVQDSTEMVTTIMGEQRKESAHSPIEGLKVLANRVGGNWTCTLEDGAANDEQADELKNMADALNVEDRIYPDGALPIGHRWEADPGVVKSMFGTQLASVSGTVSFELKRVEKKDNHEYAIIGVTLKITGISTDTDNTQIITRMALQGEIHRSLALFYDTYEELRGKAEYETKLVEEKEEIPLVYGGNISIVDVTTIK